MDKFLVEGRFNIPVRIDTSVICDLLCNDVMNAEDKLGRFLVYKEVVGDLERVLESRENLFVKGEKL
jgi:hypothetical protein